MDQNWFYLIEQASDVSKIIFSFIIYAYCLNKRTETINKLKNEQPSPHFFLTDPLFPLVLEYGTISGDDKNMYTQSREETTIKAPE